MLEEVVNTPVAIPLPSADGRRTSWWAEASACVADMGTFLPLAVGVSLVCGLDFGLLLLGAGIANLYGGWRFGQPIPVQPMKALCAIAIGAHWSSGQLAASGMLMGVVLLALTFSGAVQWAARAVPPILVRGVQLSAAVQLALAAGRKMLPLLATGKGIQGDQATMLAGWTGILLTVVALVLMWHPRTRGGWSVLVVFVAGIILSCWSSFPPAPVIETAFAWPHTNGEWRQMVAGVLPQLPLTLLNSVLAVCVLSEGYFPGKGITPKQMAGNVALMNLLLPALGAMPMCHGSGGLASLHRFGARSGFAPVILGVAMLLVGLCFSHIAMHVLGGFPVSVLAAMLLTTAFSLGAAALSPLRWNLRSVALCMGIAAVMVLLQR